MKSNHAPVLLYDDQCGFCSHWINFVVRRHGGKHVHCMALESERARKMLKLYGLDPQENDSVAYITGGRLFTYSSAVVRILRDLRFPWCLLAVLGWIPKGIRDWGYQWVARRRQRLRRCNLH